MKATWLLCALVLSVLSAAGAAAAESVIHVTLDTANVAAAIPADFSGLSFEMSQVLPDSKGSHCFRPENKPLVSLFRTLGIRSLRVGGNTADKPSVGIPRQADIDCLFGFAHAAGAKVIYTVRLKQGEPADDARIANYILEHYRSDLTCLAIGNEPNFYFNAYSAYRDQWRRFADAMPEQVLLDGPSVGPTEWVRDFITDFGLSRRVGMVSAHVYFFGDGEKVSSAAEGRNRMLSADSATLYEKFYRGFAPQAAGAGLPYRLEEVNNYYNGGAKDVSDTFAAALWGLDLMHWWAAHGAQGVNFHTGDEVAAGQEITVCKYGAFVSANDGYATRPIGYGIKAFDLGGHGRLVPVALVDGAATDLTVYARMDGDGSLLVTLINREHGPSGRDARVNLRAGEGFGVGRQISLRAPRGDVAATTGVTLGGAPIHDDGTWAGTWSALAAPGGAGFVVNVPAATALIVRLSRGPQGGSVAAGGAE